MITNFKTPSARGGIYPLVLIVCAAGAAAALTGLTIRQATDNRAAASGDLTNARLLARNGIESALQVIDEDGSWRDSFGAEETWTSTLDPGTISISISDEADGDLSDDPSEAYTITSTGKIGSTRAALSVTVSPVLTAYRQKVIAAAPMRYWPLDETSGMTAADLTGVSDASHFNSGALNGMPGYDGLPAPIYDDMFDLTYETHSSDYLLDAGTIMCWVYCTSDTDGDQMIIAKKSRTGSPGDFEILLVGQDLEIIARLAESQDKVYTLRLGNLQPKTWTHIAVSFGNQFKGFVNGTRIDKVDSDNSGWGTNGGDSPGNLENFQFGSLWNSFMPTQSLNGSIRDVVIFNSVLKKKDISGFLDTANPEFEINQNAWAWVIE